MLSKPGKWILSGLLWVWTGTLYFFIEIVWKIFCGRPETISWVMLPLAIVLAIPLERFGAELPWALPINLQAWVCTLAITASEFVAGLILNVWLGLGIWDYSNMPMNLMGQICVPFIVLWWVFSIIAIIMLDWMRYAIEGGEKPRYKLL